MALCEPWATEADLCSPCDDYSLDSGLMDDYLLAASELLFMASGQQFPGVCEETIRPCNSTGGNGPYGITAFTPISSDYFFSHSHTCTCGVPDSCGCPPLSQILLPRVPVTEITEVKVDGVVLDPSEYRLDPSSYLVALGDRHWSCCQDQRLTDDQPDTWSVTYLYGLAPPVLGVRAAAILACELYMACQPEAFSGEGECRLPRNITSVSRQGVSIAIKAMTELFVARPYGRAGPVRFGIPELDLFLATYNPMGVSAPMAFLNPDEPDIARIHG